MIKINNIYNNSLHKKIKPTMKTLRKKIKKTNKHSI